MQRTVEELYEDFLEERKAFWLAWTQKKPGVKTTFPSRFEDRNIHFMDFVIRQKESLADALWAHYWKN